MTLSKLAIAFELMRDENIDARHHFTCCQSCGSAELRSLENPDNDTIGYCFYHAQDAEGIAERKELYLSYGGFETPEDFWEAEDVAHVVRRILEDFGLEVEWNGDSATRVKVLLDDESIEMVEAWSDGFTNGKRVSYDWKYFDFNAEWDRFAEHWYSDEVQMILKESIDRLGLEENRKVAYPYSSQIRRDPWEKGDALWHLSRTNYSYSLYRDRSADALQHAYRSYNRTIARFNDRLCMSKIQFVESELWDHALYLEAKQERSVQGLVFTDNEYLDSFDEVNNPDDVENVEEYMSINHLGRALLNDALKKVAEMMFSDVRMADSAYEDDTPLLFVAKENIVFDLIGYYFSSVEKWSGPAVTNVVDLFRLDQLKSRLDL